MAASLAAIQYLPQIWTTFTLKHVGSLSIPMMLIQTPGGFLFAGSLASRLGVEGWSTWGVYLVTGTLQGCLLGMGIYYEFQARKHHSNGNVRLQVDVLERDANIWQGYMNGLVHSDSIETDDEGHHVVENGRQHERTPLLNGTKKPARR